MTSGELWSVERHRELVLSDLHPMPVEPVELDASLGLALAHGEVAAFPLPPFANSAMDGYAVRAADVVNAPVVLQVAADIPAGNAGQRPLQPGTAHRIMTGAPIPDGADAVIRVEWTDGGTSNVRIDRAVAVGAEIRPEGDDVRAGDPLGRPGQPVTPADIATFASFGIGQVAVHPRPRVAIVATGDELTPLGEQPGPGMIFDSNSHLMAALVRGSGADVVSAGHISDDIDAAIASLTGLADTADVIVTMGGVSAGAYEVVKDVFDRLGGIDFHGVAIQPGKPQGFGYLHGVPVVTLPGNPVSALVSFELFVRPALRKLGGFEDLDRPRLVAALEVDIPVSPDRRRFLPGIVDLRRLVVSPVGRRGSHLIANAAGANCLIEVPSGRRPLAAGSTVDVLWLDG